jgi:hypothetical protein
MVARGEDMPGTHDEDALVEGDEEKERDLDSVAVAEQAARATRTRQKQKATQKNRSRYLLRKLTPIPTVTCLTRSVSLNRAEKDRAEKDRAAKDVSRAAKDVSRWAAKDRSVKERGRERRWIWFRMMTSRIRKKALGIRQLLCRRSTRIGRALSWTMSAAASWPNWFAQDGYPLKILATHKRLNYKLALRAVQAIMDPKDYVSFSG